MAKGKRQEQRDKRAAAAKQQQHGNQPSPTVAPVPVQQVQPSSETQTAATTGNQQAGGQGIGEGPLSTKRSRVDWQFTIAATEAIVSVCLLILALVGALYAKGQLNAMREQNAVMIEQNKIMIAQQRPWISSDAILFREIEAGYPFPVRFEHKNTGPTPGTVIEEGADLIYFEPGVGMPGIGKLTRGNASWDLTLTDELLGDLLASGKELGPSFVIPPGGSVVYGMSGLRFLTKGDVELIKAEKIVPVSLSFIVYLDQSGNRHTTWSCSTYNVGSHTFSKDNRRNTMD